MSLSKIEGQPAAIARIQKLLAAEKLPPALLFIGPAGVGKTLAAVELAKALNCAAGGQGLFGGAPDSCGACPSCEAAEKGISPDIVRLNREVQARLLDGEPEKQSAIRIESIRAIVKDMELRSMSGGWKVAVIEDAHRFNDASSNALLKALEEPPARTLWILVTSKREDLLPTILSRCQPIRFRALEAAVVQRALERLGIDGREAAGLARRSEGSIGRALELRERSLPDPASWWSDPVAPFRLADSLPKELHLARPLADDHILTMAWHIRGLRGIEGYRDSAVRKTLTDLETLRRALRSNVDPRLTLQMAAIEAQKIA